ncbi:glycosyltransferase family 4 protein [Chitinophaga sp. ARDCPP14]|uniref:glycosyltransferase family 4 protein n=1 Tax=Chitinophaga sp. ARDCPP14 TaxID=3391139 RepID=UPI003F52479F
MRKVLIYSDCFVYSGSENVIENILRSEEIQEEFLLNFYYAYNKEYEKGIKRKFGGAENVKSVKKLINPYPQWGHPLQSGEIKGKAKRVYTRVLYTLGLVFNKIGLLQLYNGLVLFRLFKRERPDILLINNGGYPAAETCRIAAIAARMAGIRSVLFVVNNMAYPQKNIWDKWKDRYINKYVSYFITASKAASDRLAEARNFDQQKCFNIPNTLLTQTEETSIAGSGILRREFGVDDDSIVMGAVGLLTRRKGYHVLITAVAMLRQKQPLARYKLVIFGEGEERSALEKLIKDYNLDDVVILPGFRPNVMEYVRDMDIFITPSIANEDFPYVIIEAMMMGKPVVGSRVAGIPEQIDNGVTGYVVAPDAPDELVNAIQKMLDKEKIATMGRSSRERYFEKFSNRLIMKRYLEVFRSI